MAVGGRRTGAAVGCRADWWGPSASESGRCRALAGATGLPNPTTVIRRRRSRRRPNRGRRPAPLRRRRPRCPSTVTMANRGSRRRGRPALRDQFRLRLPTMWNGRFFFEGGRQQRERRKRVRRAPGPAAGGRAGAWLRRRVAGFGHDNETNNDPARGGTRPSGRRAGPVDFGYNSHDQVATAAKAIIAQYYGRAAEKSYSAAARGWPRRHDAVATFPGAVRRHPGLLARLQPSAPPWPRRGTASVRRVARGGQFVDANASRT